MYRPSASTRHGLLMAGVVIVSRRGSLVRDYETSSHPRSHDLDRHHLAAQQPPHPLIQFTDDLYVAAVHGCWPLQPPARSSAT